MKIKKEYKIKVIKKMYMMSRELDEDEMLKYFDPYFEKTMKAIIQEDEKRNRELLKKISQVEKKILKISKDFKKISEII